MRKRHEEIDIMRGLSIIAMIGIHTAAYYLHNPAIYALWDTLEFAVPIFVFCSAYLFFRQEYHHHIGHTVGYFKKRVIRLLVPYYTFLLFYIPLLMYSDPKKVTQTFILDNIFLTGGLDFNWMVLLFLLLSFLMPILMHLFNKKRLVFALYVVLSTASSIAFLFYYPNDEYRLYMLLPWSLLIVFSWVFAKYENNHQKTVILFLWSILVFAITRGIVDVREGGSIIHYQNKYPPNLYHLSYGFISIIGLYYVSYILKQTHGFIRSFIAFFSKYSYSIYFIHIAAIHYITVMRKLGSGDQPFYLFFIEVLALTAAAQLIILGIQRFSTLKRGPTI
jgi:hypothetical protein